MLSFEEFVVNIGPIFLEQIEKRVFSHHYSPPAEVRGHCPIFSRVVDIGDSG